MSQAMDQPAQPVIPEPVIQEGGTLLVNRGKILIGLLVLIAGLGYFGFMAFDSATVYYYTVGELNEIGPTPDGELVRVSGKLEASSFRRDDSSTLARFTLTDGNETLLAVHNGVLPDLFFNEHSDIILEGGYGPEGVFESQTVIVRCPSKYVAEEENS